MISIGSSFVQYSKVLSYPFSLICDSKLNLFYINGKTNRDRIDGHLSNVCFIVKSNVSL